MLECVPTQKNAQNVLWQKKYLNARMQFGIWDLSQWVLAEVKDDQNALWQMLISKIHSGIYVLCQNVFIENVLMLQRNIRSNSNRCSSYFSKYGGDLDNSNTNRLLKMVWIIESTNYRESNPIWARLLTDCWQRVVKLSFSTEILCRQSETSRVDATVLRYPYTISLTDCWYSVISRLSVNAIIYWLSEKCRLPTVVKHYSLPTVGIVSVKCQHMMPTL